MFLLATLLLVVGCSKHEEIPFEGTVVYVQQCSYDLLHPAAGYLVQLDTPDSLGVVFSHNGKTYGNVVLLFDPDRLIYAGDHLRGSFYLDEDAARLNCTMNTFNDLDELPQGVFLELTVD